MALVKRKVKEGKTATVVQLENAIETAGGRSGAQILDLTDLLQRSLRKNGASATAPEKSVKAAKAPKVPSKAPARKTAVRRAG